MANVVDSKISNTNRDFTAHYRKRSCCGQLTFTWATGLLYRGFKEELKPTELWDIDNSQKADVMHKKLKEKWNEELKKPKEKRSLQTAVFNTFGFQLFVTVMCMFGFYAQQLFTAGYIFPNLIRTLGDPSAEMINVLGADVPVYALIYAFAFALCETSRSILQNNMWYQATILGVGMQVATRELMYEKLMKLRYGQIAYGRVLNIISTDTARLQIVGQYGHFVLHSAAYLILIAIVCTITFGPAVLVGLVTMVAFIPVQGRVGKILGQIRQKAAKITDHRVSLMSEILKAMKLIKLYAWEDRFSSEINSIRAKETEKMQSAAVIVACNNVIGATSIFFVMAITFTVHVLLGYKLDAPSAFSVLALFNTARFPLVVLALATRSVAEGRIGLRRMTSLLNEDEMIDVDELKINDKDEVVVNIQGDFTWPSTSADAALSVETKKNEKKNNENENKSESKDENDGIDASSSAANDSGTLQNIDFKVKNGSLIGVVGPVGCGKSSLLVGAMLGHMDRQPGGKSTLKGKVALCMQESWIFNGTVKENILFGLKFNEERYGDVLKACALVDDLKLLPAGDLTEIGERGVNLSGGQKARISLARSVYSDADVILLDDPLSAVDVHVGKHLMDNCICGPLLKNKTRILVTHQTQFLSACDSIVVMEQGKILQQGTHDEVHSLFDSLIANGDEDNDDDDDNGDNVEMSNSPKGTRRRKKSQSMDEKHEIKSVDVKVTVKDNNAKNNNNNNKGTGKLTKKENRKAGAVSFKTLKNWINAAGGTPTLVIFLSFSFMFQLTRLATDWFLAQWTEDKFADRFVQSEYAGVYCILVLCISGIYMCGSSFYHLHALKASRNLHDRIFRQVLKGAMSFFDTTPMGQILSKFSADLDIVDTLLPQTSEQCFNLLSMCVTSTILICIVTIWFLIPMIPLVATYIYLALHFRHAIRQMKRMDNMSKAPLFGHIGSTARGLATIRAFRYTERFLEKERALGDNATKCNWAFLMSNRWIGYRLDIITTMIVTITALLCVFMRQTISPALAALCIVYALQMGGVFQYGTRLIAETEALMTSVERLTQFETSVKEEKNLNTNDKCTVGKEWPVNSCVEFKNLKCRYRPNLPYVLNGISFKLDSKKKLGICGRTGSGKSSLTLCLWRMLDVIEGGIEIDGIDSSTLTLSQLRSKLAIIPQDPVLFIGTLRSNLDPFNEVDDERIWDVLKQVHLFEFVNSLPHKLGTLVEEGGQNFSQGQCQLICFARALLRGSKLIVLDEATASVDMSTDALIGATIREAFEDCTMLIIAHRLHTIVECDYILVLDDGNVAEYDTPKNLIKKKDGFFTKLVENTGTETSKYLKGLIMK